MIREKGIDPITSSKALRIALEDSETRYFIQTNFSRPEQKPEIFLNKWISKDEKGLIWHVEIIEKPNSWLTEKGKMLNIALIIVDSKSGRIIERNYLRSILLSEYKQFLRNKKQLKARIKNDKSAGI